MESFEIRRNENGISLQIGDKPAPICLFYCLPENEPLPPTPELLTTYGIDKAMYADLQAALSVFLPRKEDIKCKK